MALILEKPLKVSLNTLKNNIIEKPKTKFLEMSQIALIKLNQLEKIYPSCELGHLKSENFWFVLNENQLVWSSYPAIITGLVLEKSSDNTQKDIKKENISFNRYTALKSTDDKNDNNNKKGNRKITFK